ncbi:MAG: WD40 domain-containing protein [Gammaproteobacteria bacterium]|nr:MAG: WD40 domain-containing protein [Gammaproteobacteria bacterium]TND05472.1 MAG: WD40 domain-containing protein [Gammaproteobacteria bacterium]
MYAPVRSPVLWLSAMLCISSMAHAGSLERVGTGSTVIDADGASRGSVMSADGRYVVFHSEATTLDARDPDVTADVYVRDRLTGTTILLSINNDGDKGNFDSFWPAISGNGRFVVFSSFASNLVPGDTNNTSDVFLADRDADSNGVFDEAGGVLLQRVSRAGDGSQANAFSAEATISADGRYVAFASDADNLAPDDTNLVSDIFLYEVATGAVERASVGGNGAQANDMSYEPFLSSDGRYATFLSSADNIAPGDNNGVYWRGADIFVRDRIARSTVLISISTSGAGGNGRSEQGAMSSDGRYVVFVSRADNLAPDDINGAADIFLHDRDTDGNGVFDEAGRSSTELISTAFDGRRALDDSEWPSISDDGRYVAFQSRATNLATASQDGSPAWRIFVRDRVARSTTLVGTAGATRTGNDDSIWPSINSNGRYVAFSADAVESSGDGADRMTGIFIHDLVGGNAPPVTGGGLRSAPAADLAVTAGTDPGIDEI